MVELQNIVKLQVFLVNLLVASRMRFSSNEHNVVSLLVLDLPRFITNLHAKHTLTRAT